MKIDNIENNENWGSIRDKLNTVISFVADSSENGFKPSMNEIEEDKTGEALKDGCFVLFETKEGIVKKIEVSKFYDIISK